MPENSEMNLGLLRLLIRIHELGTVSKAADSLQLSQPAASLALRRLRRRLGDSLFVRSGNAMLPTPRCDELVATARAVLALVDDGIFRSPKFDPGAAERVFQIALYDVGELVLLPRLLAHLQARAPGCSIHSRSIHAYDLPEALESGRAELALGFFPNLERAGFHAQRLFDEKFLTLARRGHPAIGKKKLSIEQFLALSHILVEPLGRSGRLLDQLFSDMGLKRRIVLSTPHFMSVPEIVAVTDLVATVPAFMATHYARMGKWQAFEPPVNTPSYQVKQYWHARYHRDPGHEWLRQGVFAMFNS